MEARPAGAPPAPAARRARAGAAALPPGAVRGDLSRQPFSFRWPKTSYVDVARRCRRCGATFVLTARDQKRWTEALGLKPGAAASLCPGCRRGFLRTRGPAQALADAALALSAAPGHAPAVLAYARASVALAERAGDAPLAAALAALSSLGRGGPAPVEALYLEGRCHEAAGRPGRAAAAFRRFLLSAAGRPGLAAASRDARRRLAGRGPRPSGAI